MPSNPYVFKEVNDTEKPPVQSPKIGMAGAVNPTANVGVARPKPVEDDSHLAPWAAAQVRQNGGRPSEYQMLDQKTLARAPQQEIATTPTSATSSEPGQLSPWAGDLAKSKDVDPSAFKMINGAMADANTPVPTSTAKPLPRIGVGSVPQGGDEPVRSATQSTLPAKVGVEPTAQLRPQGESDPLREALMNDFHNHTYWLGRESRNPGTLEGNGSSLAATKQGQFDAIARLQAYDHQKAALAGLDPSKIRKNIEEIMASPAARAAYFAGKGMPDPGPTPNPTGPVDINNYDRTVSSPENAGIKGLFDNKDLDLHAILSQAAGLNGIADPGHVNHQLMQQGINRRWPEQKQWDEETYVPPNPDGGQLNGNAVLRGLKRFGGVGHAAVESLFGDTSAGTGLHWRENYANRTKQRDLLSRYGFHGPVK